MKTAHGYAACFVLACTLAITIPCASTAASMNIGGSVWFAWWDFSLKKAIQGKVIPHYSLYSRYRMNPTFLYGPILSVDFAKKFGFSAVFMFTDRYRIYSRTVNIMSPEEFQREKLAIAKYDLDTTFSYSPVRCLKLFTGFKFQGYDFTGKINELDLDGTGFRQNRTSGEDRAMGAGLGLGVTVPITEGLYFQWNLSALYLNMRFNYHTDFYKLEVSPSVLYIPGNLDLTYRYHSYGGNTNMSLAYRISKISSTIIIGFRYQIIYNTLYRVDMTNYILNIPLESALMVYTRDYYLNTHTNTRNYDHFYGVSFAFVYTFELARKNEGSANTNGT